MPTAPTFFSRQNQFSIFKRKDEWLERWLDRATATETDDPTRPDPTRPDPIRSLRTDPMTMTTTTTTTRARFTSLGPGEHVLGFGLGFPAIDASRVTLLHSSSDDDPATATATATTTTVAEEERAQHQQRPHGVVFDAQKETTASLGRALGELLMECDVSYLCVTSV